MKRPNTPAAMSRIGLALNEIEEAQRLMGRACQSLGSLRYGSSKYGKARKLYDRIHAFWYEVKRFAEKPQSLSVDSEPERSDVGGGQ